MYTANVSNGHIHAHPHTNSNTCAAPHLLLTVVCPGMCSHSAEQLAQRHNCLTPPLAVRPVPAAFASAEGAETFFAPTVGVPDDDEDAASTLALYAMAGSAETPADNQYKTHEWGIATGDMNCSSMCSARLSTLPTAETVRKVPQPK